MNILFVIYDIIFLLSFIVYLPVYVYRRKITLSALKEKLGFIPWPLKAKDGCLWIQVVSVGEVNLVSTLLKEWKKISNLPIVISTTTLTGNILAKKKYCNDADVIFFPFDLSLIIKRVLKIIRPKVFIAVETEVWPNLFRQLKAKNIPITIINGRLSDGAYRRYLTVKPITKYALRQCHSIGVQNEQYKNKFVSLGADKEKVFISGNMKFESIEVDAERLGKISKKYLPLLKGQGNNLIFIAASTHRPEEEIIIEIYKNIIETEKNITLVIAPRHIERIPEIEKAAANRGFSGIRISEIVKLRRLFPFAERNPVPGVLSRGMKDARHSSGNIFLLDTIGELLYFYAVCDICFVGGSLMKHGGQNILEPIYFRKPTCFGPHMDNFRDIEERVLNMGAGIKVKDKEELQHILLRLVKDELLRDNLSQRCQKVFEQERLSLNKNLEMVLGCLR